MQIWRDLMVCVSELKAGDYFANNNKFYEFLDIITLSFNFTDKSKDTNHNASINLYRTINLETKKTELFNAQDEVELVDTKIAELLKVKYL